MVFAISEINNNPNLLPNITLGYQIYDNCLRLGVAFRGATALVSGTDETVSDLNCKGPPPVIGIIGDPGSTHSIAISSVLGLFRLPMVRDTFFKPHISPSLLQPFLVSRYFDGHFNTFC